MVVITVVAGLVLVRLVLAVVRFVRAGRAGRRYYPAMLWHRWRWRWLTRSLGLAHLDHYRKPVNPMAALVSMLPFRTSVKVHGGPEEVSRLRWPKASFRADEYGLIARVRTVPKAGRAEFEQSAQWIADAWRCHRVQIAQPAPGRLLVRGLRRDPLAEPFSMADAPAGVYGESNDSALQMQRQVGVGQASQMTQRCKCNVYLGRDEWGADRWVSLANITAAVVGGMPGTGKTTLANSLLVQLAPSPPVVQLAICDGQGGADFVAWRDRAYAYAGDDRAEAAGLLEDAHREMRHRFATVLDRTGHRNAWRAGPTEGFPLHLLIVDEANVYLDESMAKGDRQAEAHVRTCRAMLAQLVRRGRSVLMFTLLISQKPTSDSIPTQIRDNAGLRLCFGVQTIDAAVAVLGDTVRQYPTVSPVTLQGPESVGVLAAQLTTAGSPFTRLRVPEITEEAADARARALAPARPAGEVLTLTSPATPAP